MKDDGSLRPEKRVREEMFCMRARTNLYTSGWHPPPRAGQGQIAAAISAVDQADALAPQAPSGRA